MILGLKVEQLYYGTHWWSITFLFFSFARLIDKLPQILLFADRYLFYLFSWSNALLIQLREKDGLPDGYRMIYRLPMERWLTTAKYAAHVCLVGDFLGRKARAPRIPHIFSSLINKISLPELDSVYVCRSFAPWQCYSTFTSFFKNKTS